ncbi:Predicted PurR-regulated permease PerM [Rhizobium sp. RU33A]|uniref:AI-2E family transporter n=1 Tax=Rhizobium sp. RU33A TaxID=1907413 RepID=UPI000953DCD4|nr:AI-2E family transporter [Rhizobium sp. RU33A]SIR09257.1 Predicted PurR-regulated permease PerM [Rhizobium sp. RU33A]
MIENTVGQRSSGSTTTRWGRRPISIILIFAVLLLLLIVIPQTLFMIFAGLLLAILFRACGTKIGSVLSIGPTWGVAAFLVAALTVVLVAGVAGAPAVSAQIDELWRQLPETAGDLKSRVEEYTWGRYALDRLGEADLWSSASGETATRAVGSLFGHFGNAVLLLFIALYGAFDPGTYKRGFLKLIAPSLRPKAETVLSHSVETLKSWLSAQLISMAVVGVLTGLGLWIIGIPLALILGLIAGLLAFIPNIGPVLAATPGILLAVPDGPNTILQVLGVYLAVQTLESYVITPLIQKEKVSLPPLLVICTQLGLGSVYGLMGLAIATPLTALIMQIINDLYIDNYLEQEQRQLVHLQSEDRKI